MVNNTTTSSTKDKNVKSSLVNLKNKLEVKKKEKLSKKRTATVMESSLGSKEYLDVLFTCREPKTAEQAHATNYSGHLGRYRLGAKIRFESNQHDNRLKVNNINKIRTVLEDNVSKRRR
ncbi:hypothetical protein ACTA71_005748 [Dictyostelium dimigraforme]